MAVSNKVCLHVDGLAVSFLSVPPEKPLYCPQEECMDRVVHRSILKNSKTWGKNLAVVIKRICIIAYGTATAALQLDGIQPKMQDKGDKYC